MLRAACRVPRAAEMRACQRSSASAGVLLPHLCLSSPHHHARPTSLPPSLRACGARRAIARCYVPRRPFARSRLSPTARAHEPPPARPPSPVARSAVTAAATLPRIRLTGAQHQASRDRPGLTARRVGPRAAAAHVSSTFKACGRAGPAVPPGLPAAAEPGNCPRFSPLRLQRRHTRCRACFTATPPSRPRPLPSLSLSRKDSPPRHYLTQGRGVVTGEVRPGGGSRAPIHHY
ncbi:hypothetical protein PVAP13_9NG181673 [Panicum virgatum]|uniref:Uncharacterized protein n=1 Tax=Panicum virgatum TaxID=38727 RepID=A0A8T0MMD9_PANVG|nr:hypothetical protein PVAP13_9NG181673 [Panicum virgatum]